MEGDNKAADHFTQNFLKLVFILCAKFDLQMIKEQNIICKMNLNQLMIF